MPNFSPAAFAAALILAASPALAQRQVEFGYKDRIFEQNYLLPENVSALDARAVVVMLALRLPGSRDLRLISAMGGQCGATFVHDNDAESSSWPKATPTQVALDRLPAEARVRRPEPDPMEEMKRPATLDEACVLQEIMFGKAYRDSLSTESQLASLAKSMRRRFTRSWVPPRR